MSRFLPMPKIGDNVLILFIVLLPWAILLLLGLFWFGSIPISNTPPSWGDCVNFIAMFFVVLSVYLLFSQIKTQRTRDELSRINNLLDEIPSLIETIQYSSKTGTDAIVSFTKEYIVGETPHPRVVIDKIQYSICLIRMSLVDLTKIDEKAENIRIAQKACLLFYTHLYFTTTSRDTNGKYLFDKLEHQYDQFKRQFTQLQQTSYHLLRKWDLVGEHYQSECFSPIHGEELGDLATVYKYFD